MTGLTAQWKPDGLDLVITNSDDEEVDWGTVRVGVKLDDALRQLGYQPTGPWVATEQGAQCEVRTSARPRRR